jgi:hypothetical protein
VQQVLTSTHPALLADPERLLFGSYWPVKIPG